MPEKTETLKSQDTSAFTFLFHYSSDRKYIEMSRRTFPPADSQSPCLSHLLWRGQTTVLNVLHTVETILCVLHGIWGGYIFNST